MCQKVRCIVNVHSPICGVCHFEGSSKGSLETVRNGTPRSTRSDQSQLKLPHSLEEVDNGKILGFGADLSEDHPVS